MRKGRKPNKVLIAALVLGIFVTATGISMVRHQRSIIKDEQTTESLQEVSTEDEAELTTETTTETTAVQTVNPVTPVLSASGITTTEVHQVTPSAANNDTTHNTVTPGTEAPSPQPQTPAASQPAPVQPTEEPAKPQPASEPTTEAEKEKAYETVWVVDREAWTETVPKYETRQVDVCSGCGAELPGNGGAVDHIMADMDDACGGYHSENRQIQVGTETIEHPEEGHWEQVEIER